jgi:exodeoxyribonuclease-3
MRIATWNVNGLRARQDFLLHWLRTREPDLVALQELKLPDGQFPHDVFAQAGYQALAHGQKSWNGVAVLAKKPITPVQIGLPGQEELGARWLEAEVEGLLFASVYCPNGKHIGHPDFAKKLLWYDALAEHLAGRHRLDAGLVLGGDFNVCPAPIDSHDEAALAGHIFHTDEERARFGRLLGTGLVDLFRHLHPELQAFTWWDYRAGAFHRRQGLRIDFLLATPDVAARVRAVAIDRDWRKKRGELVPSDHAPVWADLDPAPEPDPPPAA